MTLPRVVFLAIAILTAVVLAQASPAAAQDQVVPAEEAPAESLVLPAYRTTYDLNHTRELWGQDLSYSLKHGRTSFNLTGALDTQSFLKSESKSTVGSIEGSLNYGLVGTWQLVLAGDYAMNSSLDRTRATSARPPTLSSLESRDNRLSIGTQYLFYPVRHMFTFLNLSTEFEQKHDRSSNDKIDRADTLNTPGEADTSRAQRDSSYTTSRKDAFQAEIRWPATRWLQLHQNTLAYRTEPTIASFKRGFNHALDGSGGGYVVPENQKTTNPSGNLRFTGDATISRGMSKLVVTGTSSSLQQSYFDKQRSQQENTRFNSTLGTFTFDTHFWGHLNLHSEGSTSRNLNRYELASFQTTLLHSQHALALLTILDSTFNANLNFSVDRTRTELHPASNGVSVNRTLGGLFQWRKSRRLVLDGNGSANLQGNDYENDKNDRDDVNNFFSLGGGYMLTPACSTTVHFSRGWKHGVALDPSFSGGNAVTTTYQMNATLVYLPTRNFSLRQAYLINAEYRILDYVDTLSSLSRARRVDTDIADTLWSWGFVGLSHNFVFRDSGIYAHYGGQSNRSYNVATRTYDQTVTATVGAKLAPGVLFFAAHTLINNRAEGLARKTRTNQNTFKLNLSLQVFRTLDNGFEIDGALRRLGEYVEGHLDSKDSTRDEWVAGVSVRKAF